MSRIAVGPTIVEAARFCLRNIGRMFLMGLIPVVVYFMLSTWLDTACGEEAGRKSWGAMISCNVGSDWIELVFVPFFVAWHRLTLLGDPGTRWLALPRIGRREALYAGYTLIVYLVFLPENALIDWSIGIDMEGEQSLLFISGYILLLVGSAALWTWVAIRFSFLFVEVAIDGRTELFRGWSMTREYAFDLLLVGLPNILVFVLVMVIAVVIGFVPTLTLLDFSSDDIFDMSVDGAVSFAIVVVGAYWVSATTIAFRDVTGWKPEQPVAA